MFKGLGLAMIAVTSFLVVVPGLMLWAEGGAEWVDMLRKMTPSL